MMLPVTRQQWAFLSWCMDLAAAVVVVVLLKAWITDLHHLATLNDREKDDGSYSTNLSKSFLESGFCNSSTMNTQWMCTYLDITSGLLFIAFAMTTAAKKNRSSKLLLPAAGYLLAHGYGHYQVASKKIESLQELETLPLTNMLTLAIIIAVGPMEGMSVVIRKLEERKGIDPPKRSSDMEKKYKALYYGGVSIGVMALVLVYAYGLRQKQNYALLYINLSILLTRALPRIFLLGFTDEADVAYRLDKYPYLGVKYLTGTAVLALVYLEPFYCDVFLAKVGGHFLFDLALLVDAICSIINDTARFERSTQLDKSLEKKEL